MQYLYNDGDFHFMDNNNYEQVSLDSNAVGDAANYLTENMLIEVSFFKGRSIGISLPNFVVLEVTETAPGEKGNTVTGASKPAVVSTGYSVNVPLFVNEGDQLRIDTRTGEYSERVKV
jgi:elongation factor P